MRQCAWIISNVGVENVKDILNKWYHICFVCGIDSKGKGESNEKF